MISDYFTDELYMRKALKEAEKALDEDEVPVGAIIVCNQQIIGKGYNQVESLNDVTAHAEMLAITAAGNYLGSKYLENCRLFVTLEPCIMCASAISNAQIPEIIYGAPDPKKGFSLCTPAVFNSKISIQKEILMNDCADIINNFFKKKRLENSENKKRT